MHQSRAIVVFGGAGFIGTHLLGHLSRNSGAGLYSVDIKAPKRPVEGVTYLTHDVRDLTGFGLGGEVGTIFNLAAVHTTPGHEDHEYFETNVLGASEVTAFARRCGCKEIVFTSSISVYGPGEETKDETTPPAPTSAYGRSKRLAETIHMRWMDEAADRNLRICRPAVIFGRGEGGNFTRMASLLRKGWFVYPGRKDTIKACVYVEDLVESFDIARGRPERFVLYNGCYPDRYTLEQIVEAFRGSYAKSARTVMVPRAVVMGVARALRPVSTLGLGVHPDRVTKLVKSTDVFPGWLDGNGYAKRGQIQSALDRWASDSNGTFV